MTYTQIFNAPSTSARYEIEAATLAEAVAETRQDSRHFVQPCRWSVSADGVEVGAESATAPAWYLSEVGPFERFGETR